MQLHGKQLYISLEKVQCRSTKYHLISPTCFKPFIFSYIKVSKIHRMRERIILSIKNRDFFSIFSTSKSIQKIRFNSTTVRNRGKNGQKALKWSWMANHDTFFHCAEIIFSDLEWIKDVFLYSQLRFWPVMTTGGGTRWPQKTIGRLRASNLKAYDHAKTYSSKNHNQTKQNISNTGTIHSMVHDTYISVW